MPGQDALLDGMVDDYFADGLSALEVRRQLERSVSLAADIERDLAGNGPLFLYLQERRKLALDALEALVGTDPNDAVAVARQQAVINEYLRPCAWIASKRQDGAQDAATIREDYPDDGDEPDRYQD